MTGFADGLDRFLLLLVVISAALGVTLPGPGRHADAGGAILATLAVLVFCTGASLTFTEVADIRTASRRLVLVLAVTTVTLPALAWLASRLVTGGVLRGGVLAAGVAPAEVASVALTGLAGGEVALAAGLLIASTLLTVLLAGPILSLLGAHSSASTASWCWSSAPWLFTRCGGASARARCLRDRRGDLFLLATAAGVSRVASMIVTAEATRDAGPRQQAGHDHARGGGPRPPAVVD